MLSRCFRHFEADSDLMLQVILVSVFDSVGHDFLNGEVGGEDDFGGSVIAFEQLRRRVERCPKIIEIIIDLEDEMGHRPSFRLGRSLPVSCRGSGWLR